MARKWNPDIPTNRDDVVAVFEEAGIDPSTLIELRYADPDELEALKVARNESSSANDGSYHLYYIIVDRESALAERDRLKPIAAAYSLFPVFSGEALFGIGYLFFFNDDPIEILAASNRLEATDRAAEWYDERRTIEDLESDPGFSTPDWPTTVPLRDRPFLQDAFVQAGKSQIAIVFLPGTDPIDAVVHLDYGGNQPQTALMIAYLRQWRQRYGIDVICIAYNSIELRVDRPPQDKEDALMLARECMLLCDDIWNQSTEVLGFECNNVQTLAAHLMGSTFWYFWWD